MRRAALLLLLLASCGEPVRELREWTPADHSQPAGAVEQPQAPSDPVQAERQAAASLFASQCASCHGAMGRGDGPGRPPVANVPDLSLAEWQDTHTDEQIGDAILRGRPPFMPSFALAPAGVRALTRHVRMLGGREIAAPAAALAPTDATGAAPAPAAADAPAATPTRAPAPAPTGPTEAPTTTP